MSQSNLKPCLDCGNLLSPSAKACPKCNSTDPFHYDLKKRNRQTNILLLGLLFILAVFAAFYFNLLTLDMVKNFISDNLNRS